MTERRQENPVDAVRFAVLESQLTSILTQTAELKKMFEQYVTQHEFRPVRILVFGGVGLMLTGVMSALIALVLAK